MLRIALTSSRQAARAFSSRTVVRPTTLALASRPRPIVSSLQHVRFASGGGLDKEQVTARILDVLKTFEKVDDGKISPTAAFAQDLGLDSLDAVEVVMAIEEEFGVEIPDADADEITTVSQAVDYIAKTPEAH